VAANACTAVGDSRNSNGTQGSIVAERWDGTAWTIQNTPTPTGATFNGLGGVSCTSATACTASGGTTDSAGTTVTLAERYGQ